MTPLKRVEWHDHLVILGHTNTLTGEAGERGGGGDGGGVPYCPSN